MTPTVFRRLQDDGLPSPQDGAAVAHAASDGPLHAEDAAFPRGETVSQGEDCPTPDSAGSGRICAPRVQIAAWHIRAADGVGLRVAHWRAADVIQGGRDAGRAPLTGSVLLFPGRGEYVEKYDGVAADLTAWGLSVLAIDWRGQGGSDRLVDDSQSGHISDFAHYQRDVAAMVVAAEDLSLPRPWHLLAHSMGGCIGLRALGNGLPVVSAAFSAPMWGIRFGRLPAPWGAGIAGGIARAAGRTGRGAIPVPGPSSVLEIGFAHNLLTSDLDSYIRLMREAAAWPDLMAGPPSYDWVRAALAECRALARTPSSGIPALISLSQDEALVSQQAIRSRVNTWSGAHLLEIAGARHEVLFEQPAIRRAMLDALRDLFAQEPRAPST